MHTQLQCHNSEAGKWQICAIIIWLVLSWRWCHKLSGAAQLYCSEAAPCSRRWLWATFNSQADITQETLQQNWFRVMCLVKR